MIKNNLPVLLIFFLPCLVFSNNIQINHNIKDAAVNDKGELIYHNDTFSYQNWNSSQLIGKVRVIQHIAGLADARKMNASLMDIIRSSSLPREHYQTTTIVNINDAIWGTAVFVLDSIQESKRAFPWSQFIVDEYGEVRKAWDLSHKGSVIVVLDRKGIVHFVKDGPLSTQEVEQVMTLLHQLIEK